MTTTQQVVVIPEIQMTFNTAIDIIPPDATYDELEALFAPWLEEFSIPPEKTTRISSKDKGYLRISIAGRRMWSLVPMIIRKCQRIGYDVAATSKDYRYVLKDGGMAQNAPYEDIDFYGHATLVSSPEWFWRILALGQMWTNSEH